jgi:hypothetical protein
MMWMCALKLLRRNHKNNIVAKDNKMASGKSQKIRSLLAQVLIYLIEEIPLCYYMIFFILAVLVFGIIYYILTPYSNGLGSDGKLITELTFGNAIYFSVVTVSSLGYGDISPMGFSRVLACLEVLSGLILMGIMLAKMTSIRLSYHVARLFSSEIQKRMSHFAEEFETLHIQTSNFSQTIAQIPGRQPVDQPQAMKECAETVSAFHRRSYGLADYIAYEVEHCNFFSIAPTDAVIRMAAALNQTIFLLGQMVIGMTSEARKTLLTPTNRKQLLDAIDKNKEICWMIRKHCMNSFILNEFSEILKICENFPENFFAVPILMEEDTQPDQTFEKSIEPQHED